MRQGIDCTAGNPEASYRFLASRGLTLVRLALPWSFLQPRSPDETTEQALKRGLDPAAVAIVRAEVSKIEAAGMRVVLDLHNNGTYPASQGEFPKGTVWFGRGLEIADARRIWMLLSEEFADEQAIAAYDLFNEVQRSMVDVDLYKNVTRAVVSALRAAGDTHPVWVEGMKEVATGGVAEIAPDGPWIDDPLDRVVYSQHFYPGGTGTELRADATGSPAAAAFLGALEVFGEWCDRHGARCSIGEVGWPSDESLNVTRGSVGSWTDVGERFYEIADRYDMDVTYFGSTKKSSCGWLMAYCGDGEEIDDARSQSTVIERHLGG